MSRHSMAAAVMLQTKLAKIAPPDMVRPRPGSTVFPMTAAEMLWQLEFFAAMVGDEVAAGGLADQVDPSSGE